MSECSEDDINIDDEALELEEIEEETPENHENLIIIKADMIAVFRVLQNIQVDLATTLKMFESKSILKLR